jgi:hypothetical protein
MYHASLYGGAIAVRELPVNNGRQLVPEIPISRLVLVPVSKGAAPTQVVRGMLSMDGERISLVVGIWQKVAGVLVREMGF